MNKEKATTDEGVTICPCCGAVTLQTPGSYYTVAPVTFEAIERAAKEGRKQDDDTLLGLPIVRDD